MNKKVFLKTIYWMGIVGIFLWADGALAAKGLSSLLGIETNSAFRNAYDSLYTTFRYARNIVYILSGFGLIGFAVAAIFGKLNFKWLAMICIGLAVLAGADSIIGYSTSSHVQLDASYRGIGDEDFDLDLQWQDYD